MQIKLWISLKSSISRKNWILLNLIKFIFGMQINSNVFCKLILPIRMWLSSHVQSSQNKKFVYLCNFCRKAWGIKFILRFMIIIKFKFKFIVTCFIKGNLPECSFNEYFDLIFWDASFVSIFTISVATLSSLYCPKWFL